MPNALTTDREREQNRLAQARYYARNKDDPEFMARCSNNVRRYYAAHRSECRAREKMQDAGRRAVLAKSYVRKTMVNALRHAGTPAKMAHFTGCPELIEAWTMVIKCGRMFAVKTKNLRTKERNETK